MQTFRSLYFKTLLFIITTLSLLTLLLLQYPTVIPTTNFLLHAPPSKPPRAALTLHNIFFSIAGSSQSYPMRLPYVNLWYSNTTRAVVFLDKSIPDEKVPGDGASPEIIISGDTTRFPYFFPNGLRSAIRVARVVKETVDRVDNRIDGDLRRVRWFVFGDDDTVFFKQNLVTVLSKYDDELWYYIGGVSEIYDQNAMHSFEMAYGGGGFAISGSLAMVLANVLDDCLSRYGGLYGSDSRICACLAELGVSLTREPGFHQVDIRGNLFGMLSAHPLSPILSLHHLDNVESIFPSMNKTQALSHLFEAVNKDPSRVLQQTICYDRSKFSTISISWGYAIQVYEGNRLLLDLISVQKTFRPWRRAHKVFNLWKPKELDTSHYMFDTRESPSDPCENPDIFFMETIVSTENDGVRSDYIKHVDGSCVKYKSFMNVTRITVFSPKLEFDIKEVQAPRRQCCDVVSSLNDSMTINIRHCGMDEQISMH